MFTIFPFYFRNNDVEVVIIERRSIRDKNIDRFNLQIQALQILETVFYSMLASVLNSLITILLNNIHSKDIKKDVIDNKFKVLRKTFLKLTLLRDDSKNTWSKKLRRAFAKLKFLMYLRKNWEESKLKAFNSPDYFIHANENFANSYRKVKKHSSFSTNNSGTGMCRLDLNDVSDNLCLNIDKSNTTLLKVANVARRHNADKKMQIANLVQDNRRKNSKINETSGNFHSYNMEFFSSPNSSFANLSATVQNNNNCNNNQRKLSLISNHLNHDAAKSEKQVEINDRSEKVNNETSSRTNRTGSRQKSATGKHLPSKLNLDAQKESNHIFLELSASERTRIVLKNILGTTLIILSWVLSVIFIKKIYEKFRDNIFKIVIAPVITAVIMNMCITECLMIFLFSVLSWVNFELRFFGISGFIFKVLSLIINPLIQQLHKTIIIIKDLNTVSKSK